MSAEHPPSSSPDSAITRLLRLADSGTERQDLPCVLWFTGLSGAGKTTIARAVADRLQSQSVRVAWIDGDVVRDAIGDAGRQIGFSREARDLNVLYAGLACQLLEQAGACVIASFISPYRDTRDRVRALCSRFVEVHVSTPLSVCELRDVKGLYAKARAGEISQFTGIDAPYEPPVTAELELDTSALPLGEAVDRVIAAISRSLT